MFGCIDEKGLQDPSSFEGKLHTEVGQSFCDVRIEYNQLGMDFLSTFWTCHLQMRPVSHRRLSYGTRPNNVVMAERIIVSYVFIFVCQ